jgi:FkbM family methyltransferase
MSLLLEIMTSVRALGRQYGITPWMVKTLNLVRGSSAYEERFSNELLMSIQPGDQVWDVGANIGFYTAKLSERTGPNGAVCAFEPAPGCFTEIEKLGLPNIKAFNIALGEAPATLPLNISQNLLGDTHSLVHKPLGSEQTVYVRVAKGDDIRQEAGLPAPNVVKVDVEGFEEEVLKGLQETLKEPGCRAVFVEVHFGILDQRGRRRAPASIEKYLKELGFHTHWIDASHIGATRRT